MSIEIPSRRGSPAGEAPQPEMAVSPAGIMGGGAPQPEMAVSGPGSGSGPGVFRPGGLLVCVPAAARGSIGPGSGSGPGVYWFVFDFDREAYQTWFRQIQNAARCSYD